MNARLVAQLLYALGGLSLTGATSWMLVSHRLPETQPERTLLAVGLAMSAGGYLFQLVASFRK
jgi:hypothetical protein